MKMKILVVENQNFQYIQILDRLENNGIEYFPDKDKYIEFIDYVRVWVNDGYNYNSYREKSLEYIYNILQKKNFDLILMDHILGGAYHCKTGIDLACALNEKMRKDEKKCIPVVFLSKTEDNLESRLKEYEEYEKKFPDTSIWIHKGYFGDELLNETYFKEQVLKGIEKVINLYKIDAGVREDNKEKEKYAELFEVRISNLKRIEMDSEDKKEMDILKNKLLPILKDKKRPITNEIINLLYKIESNISEHNSNKENYLELECLLNKI